MTKKHKQKQPSQAPQAKKMERQETKVLRLAHDILINKINPANLTLEEAIDALTSVAKAIVISNTADDAPDDRAGMIEWMEERFFEGLAAIDPSACDHLHAWVIQPQGSITETIGVLWSGDHEEDSVKVVLGIELETFRLDLARMKDEVHVVEGIEGIAVIDPDWDGEDTRTCANPACGKVHDVHLTVAESLFEQAKRMRAQPAQPN